MARERQLKKRDEHEIEFSRIVAFSDGVFSIAITLLVLDLKLPDTLSHGEVAHALWEQRENFIAYAISFAVIARFWVLHHSFFSEVKAFDTRLITLNMLYLGFVVLIPFSSQVFGEYGGTLAAVILYSSNLACVVLVGQWMRWDARRDGLTTISDEKGREDAIASFFIVIVFVLSILIGLITPRLAPYAWLLLFFEGRGRVIERYVRNHPRG
jgi:uncharacterized membrane protein